MGRAAKPKDKKKILKDKQRQRKKESKKNKHRARLIVRNLPFDTTEENLRQHFEQFGEIDEVQLLKKEDGKLLGCGFVQFKLVQKAAKARHHLNGKPFLDRSLECDWAVAKSKYEAQQSAVQIKTEPVDDSYEDTVVKAEPVDASSEPKTELVDVNKEDCESVPEVKSDGSEDEQEIENFEAEVVDEKEAEDVENEEQDMDDEEQYIEDEKQDIKDGNQENIDKKKPFIQSNDASEGRTVFIKNVPFTTTNEDLRQCFLQFGPLYYALVCMDPFTEHSKGTAFVKFRNKEDADKCLQTDNITLLGNTLDCKPAVTRDELQKTRENNKKPRQRDSRNIYLIKEGVVLAGTKAAEGVSATDMAKRLQVEQYKNQMLKNLNMFIARTRLIIHNLPPNWDDTKLRALFKKYSSTSAIIKEARIMRNMRIVDNKGNGKSKEYGFVTFTTHEAALEALRSINNNPDIFTPSKRPIVAFSIENRAKLQAKERRLHNSQVKNPLNKKYDPNAAKFKYKRKREETQPVVTGILEKESKQFSGVAATPGVKKMRSKFNLRTQAQIHHQQLKKEKKSKKFAKKTLKQKQAEFTKQPRQKINKNNKKESDDFSRLVNDYKLKLFSSPSVQEKKKKWFE